MGYSTTITAVIFMVLAQVLPLIGVEFSSEALTTTVQVLIAVGGGLWIWYRKLTNSEITPLGFRK